MSGLQFGQEAVLLKYEIANLYRKLGSLDQFCCISVMHTYIYIYGHMMFTFLQLACCIYVECFLAYIWSKHIEHMYYPLFLVSHFTQSFGAFNIFIMICAKTNWCPGVYFRTESYSCEGTCYRTVCCKGYTGNGCNTRKY